MAHICVPDSLPMDSQYAFEATQLSQPQFSQTQNTQYINSQVEPRRKYWATLIPINPQHRILKIPWSRRTLQIGRGPAQQTNNDVVLAEKRVSNKHCIITLGIDGQVDQSAIGDLEPDVWIEDLKSSNGTFVNGEKLRTRQLLRHGDEISLGHVGTLENHDVRYIFRSVGGKGTQYGKSEGKIEKVGEVYEKYQFLETLGSGSFADVRKAVDVETGDLRAIKQIVTHRFASNPKTLELFRREIDICQSLQHENICRLIEAFEDPQHVCLVLEYVDGGDLLDFIMNYKNPNGGGLPEDVAAPLTLQMCRAMAYTHAKGVTHRDLKPENILLTKETPNCPRQVKIADFGLAKMVHSGTMLVSMVGTPQYLAPEVVMQSKQQPGYENVVDSWSIGIIVYSMLTKALPFDEDEDLPVDKRIKSRYHVPADTHLLHQLGASVLAIDFIMQLLAKNPADRMSMEEALEHPWLSAPSSQHSESQRYQLGGDSVFEIESFDDDYAYEPDSLANGDWSRPMTASGTNLASGMGLQDGASIDMANSPSPPPSDGEHDSPMAHRQTSIPPRPQADLNGVSAGPMAHHGEKSVHSSSPPPSPPGGHASPVFDRAMSSPPPSPRPKRSMLGNGVSTNSADDFSQPMQQLHLKSSMGHGHLNGLQPTRSSPPSPPLTDEQMDGDRVSTPAVADAEPVKQEQGSCLLTPVESMGHDAKIGVKSEPPGTATKRKAADVGFFSSGSLSPPPTESIELESPSRKVKSEEGVKREPSPAPAPASTKAPPATRGRAPRRSTRSTMKADVDAPAPKAPARGRKSMRLS